MTTTSTTYAAQYPTALRATRSGFFTRALARVVEVIATEYRIRRDTRHLMSTSDDMLKDIGLSRAEVARVVRSGVVD